MKKSKLNFLIIINYKSFSLSINKKNKMFKNNFLESINNELEILKNTGLYKGEYEIISSQSANIEIFHQSHKKRVLNFCANNYLGLANNKNLLEIAKKTIDEYGLGTASVRFICGTFDLHKKFENKLAEFLDYEDVITFSSCFSANGGVFASLLTEEDAIISADLNHASLIDGIRLCKAHRYFYKYNDMAELEKKLIEASKHKNLMIVTDGVFSMDGDIANLKAICDLARGTPEHCGVEGRVDILVSTLGKALGGAGGGFIASKKNVIDKLRNKARPYLFSNNILPIVASVGIEILEMIGKSKYLIKKLADNTLYFRKKIIDAGFVIHDPQGIHPVVPIMLGDAVLASKFAKMMIEEEGIYVIAFSFPVVPKDTARIRVQISACHEKEHLDEAISAFIRVGKKLNVIK